MNKSVYEIGDLVFSKKHKEIGKVVEKQYKSKLIKKSDSETYKNKTLIEDWLYVIEYTDKRCRSYYQSKLLVEFEDV